MTAAVLCPAVCAPERVCGGDKGYLLLQPGCLVLPEVGREDR